MSEKMKKLISIVTFILTIFSGICQENPENEYGMSTDQNKIWLTKINTLAKGEQLILVQNRFFKLNKPLTKSENEDVPVLIIDGIAFSEKTKNDIRQILYQELRAENVKINILVKEPDNWHANKRWTGFIFMNITDNKIRKKIKKLN